MTAFDVRVSVVMSRDSEIRLMFPSGKALALTRRAVSTYTAGSGSFRCRLEDVAPKAIRSA